MIAQLPLSRFAATALVSAAVLVLEIAVTRLLSVVLWYHWAFFSISTAMLGLSAPAVWWAVRGFGPRALPRALLGASWLLPLGIVLIVKATRWFAPFSVVFCLVCLLPALLCLGTALCLLVVDAPERSLGALYAADLLGGCCGALLAVPLMQIIPAPLLAAGLGLLPLGACLLVDRGRPRAIALLALGECALLIAREPLQVRQTKAYDESWQGYQPIYERWTATTRITVFPSVFWRPARAAFGWGFGLLPAEAGTPEQYWLEQDGSAGTPITHLVGSPRDLGYLLGDVTAVGYRVRAPRSVAVVGAGGGRDILAALSSGAERVHAIELNRAIVEALRGPFAEFSGRVYDLPGVTTEIGDGRGALTRSSRRYDLIQIALTDSWASTAAGAYALAENSLYTLEGYRLYWSRLSPAGMVSTSRWMAGSSGLEMTRLLILARAALEAEGIGSPEAHLALYQGGQLGTLLISRSPWSDADQQRMVGLSRELGFVLHWPPLGGPRTATETKRILDRGAEHYRAAGLRLEPPTDDRPFFFQMTSPWRGVDAKVVGLKGLTLQPVAALRVLMGVVAALALVLFLAPWWWWRRGRGRLGGGRLWRGSAYFTLIGAGFMLVETAWVQSTIVQLAHPSHGAAAVLGGLMLGSGVGAALSRRLSLGTACRFGWIAAMVVMGTTATLGPATAQTWGWPDLARMGAVMGLLVPSGILLGMGLPLGMRRFGRAGRGWFWALTGVAGVLGAVMSLALAMEWGYTRVSQLGALAYVVGWLSLWGHAADSRREVRDQSRPKKACVTTSRPTC